MCMYQQKTTDDKEVYDPSDFMRLYHLVCHSQFRTAEDLFHRCVLVAFLIKALKKTKYFDGKGASLGECAVGHCVVTLLMFENI